MIEKSKTAEDAINNVTEFMVSHQIQGKIIRHRNSGKTTEMAESSLEISRDKILKSLLFKSKKGEYVAAIISGKDKVDTDRLEKLSGLKKIRLANDDEINHFLGFKAGGIPPFAFFKKCATFVDSKLLDLEFVIGAAGTEYAGVKFNPKTFKTLGYTISSITNIISKKS